MRITHSHQMIDIAEPDVECEVSIDNGADGITVWVNVDGVCRLRVCRILLSHLKVNYSPARLLGDPS